MIVNGNGAHRRKRFTGQILVRWLQPTNNDAGTEILSAYITAGSQYALHTRTIPYSYFPSVDEERNRYVIAVAAIDGQDFTRYGGRKYFTMNPA